MDTTPAGIAAGPSSPTLGQLAAALALAQAKMAPAAKDKKNPHFGSRYADLAGVWDACREALSANGLAVIQLPEDAGAGRVALRTVLAHKSGEWVQTVVSAPLAKSDAQAVGSALTYLRRYSLAAMVGVAPDDDDGNAASGRDAPTATQPPPRTSKRPDPEPAERSAPKHDPSWDADRARFCASIEAHGLKYDHLAEWCELAGRSRPSAMPQAKRDALLTWLGQRGYTLPEPTHNAK